MINASDSEIFDNLLLNATQTVLILSSVFAISFLMVLLVMNIMNNKVIFSSAMSLEKEASMILY